MSVSPSQKSIFDGITRVHVKGLVSDVVIVRRALFAKRPRRTLWWISVNRWSEDIGVCWANRASSCSCGRTASAVVIEEQYDMRRSAIAVAVMIGSASTSIVPSPDGRGGELVRAFRAGYCSFLMR